ncbi:MAG TPA: GxxExxY protein [Gemmatimonadaceae bacterium]|nr:GxxExxY protein [Gemmatimonadaceae bacterium]
MRNAPKRDLLHADLTRSVIGAFYRVYNRLDYGFLESIYAEALSRVLLKSGHEVRREVGIVVYFEGEAIGLQRVDMIVDGLLIVEIKSSHDVSKSSHRQLMSYLRGSEMEVGLLLHFGPRPDFYRVVNTRSPRFIQADPR